MEKHGEPASEVVAIGAGGFDVVVEGAFFEHAGIISKKAKEQAHQVDLKLVTGIAVFFEGIVELRHFVGGISV